MAKDQFLPRWLIGAGVPLVVAVTAFAIRLVWEQTILSWNRGPQMVGFSLMHGGLGVFFVVVSIVAAAWLILMLGYMAIRRSAGGLLGGAAAAVCAISLVAILVPYSWWQATFASRLVQGPFAAEFLSMSAAGGHERVAEALLENGAQVNARTHEGSTALHAAAGSGQMPLVKLLIASGADINAVNRYGDSPLARAESGGHAEVAEFLRKQGAQLIRGTAEERDRAAREIVDERSRGSR